MLFYLLACETPAVTDSPAPPESCAQTWEEDGAAFVRTYCTACHGPARAESGLRLDTLSEVQGHLARVQARVEEGTMPPGGGPSAQELADFLAWADCGAPGRALEAVVSTPLASPTGAWLVAAEVVEEAPGAYRVTWSEPGLTVAEQLWEASAERVALVESGRWVEGDWVVDGFEPALQVWDASTSSWTQSLTRTRIDALGTDSWPQDWTAVRYNQIDARAVVKAGRGFELTSDDGDRVHLQRADEIWLDWWLALGPEGPLHTQTVFQMGGMAEAIWDARALTWE